MRVNISGRRRFRRRLSAVALGLIMLTANAWAQSWVPTEISRLTGEDESVSVSSGQSLYDLARARGYALEHLAEANGLPVSLAVVERETVLVPSRRILPREAPANGLVVNLPERGFYVFRSDKETGFFPIAIGEPGRFQTPTGSFSIVEKVVDPQWIAPEWAGLGEDNVIPAGPDNPLGDRWIGLTSSGLGMHSTNNPSSIGSATSHGCMRMYPEIARMVFDRVEVGWPVRIEYETSRVSLEKDGIYAVCFPDPYGMVDRKAQLQDKFQELDLDGFYSLIDVEPLLARKSGVCTKLVDLEVRATVDGKSYPAARVGGKVYLEGSALEKLGVRQDFKLADKVVRLSLGEKSVVRTLRFDSSASPSMGEVFLSRGGAWYPAKEVLQSLSLGYEWNGSSKELAIGKPD